LAGLNVGDVIVEFNGQEVMNSANLPPIVGSSKVGVKLPVGIIRNGREMEIKVKLEELPEDGTTRLASEKQADEETNRFGLTAIDLSDDEKAELNLAGGVVVNRIVNGAASQAGVRKGDVILSIDNKTVKDVEQFRKLVKDLPAGKAVALLLQRNGSPTFLAIKVPDDE
jgi:serine protease Do